MSDLDGLERDALEQIADIAETDWADPKRGFELIAPIARAALAAREEPSDPGCPAHRQSFLEGWEAARTETTSDPIAEANEAWRLAWGDSPGAALRKHGRLGDD